jgi:hypothetical protein
MEEMTHGWKRTRTKDKKEKSVFPSVRESKFSHIMQNCSTNNVKRNG